MKTFYLDMDGVVADFNGYASVILNKNNIIDDRWPDEEWNQLKSNSRIYRDLEKTVEADDIVKFSKEFCKNNGYQLMFLTAVPKGNDIKWAFYDKVNWILKYYSDVPVMFGPYSKDKKDHCISGDILLDDRKSNIDEWNQAGGIGILYRNDLDRVIDFLTNYV